MKSGKLWGVVFAAQPRQNFEEQFSRAWQLRTSSETLHSEQSTHQYLNSTPISCHWSRLDDKSETNTLLKLHRNENRRQHEGTIGWGNLSRMMPIGTSLRLQAQQLHMASKILATQALIVAPTD